MADPGAHCTCRARARNFTYVHAFKATDQTFGRTWFKLGGPLNVIGGVHVEPFAGQIF